MKKIAVKVLVALSLMLAAAPVAYAQGSGSGSAVVVGSGSAVVVDTGSAAAPPVIVTPPKEGDSKTTVATTTETTVQTVDPNDTNTLLEIMVGNFKSGRFGVAAIALVLIFVGFLRKIEKVKTNKWLSWALNFITSFAIVLIGAAGIKGAAITGALIWNAALGAFATAGVLELLRDLAEKHLFGKKEVKA